MIGDSQNGQGNSECECGGRVTGRRSLLRAVGGVTGAGLLGRVAGNAAAQSADSESGAPAGLRTTETTPTSISIAWDPPQDGGEVDHYEVWVNGEYAGDSQDVTFSRFDASVTTTVTETTLDRLPPGFEFDVFVTAVRADGTEATAESTAATAAATGEEPPATPGDRRLTADGTDVTLSWEPVVIDDLSHYELRWWDYAPPGAGMPDRPVRRTVSPERTSAQIPRGTDVQLLAVDEGGNASEPTTVRVAETVPEDGARIVDESFTVTDDVSPADEVSIDVQPAVRTVEVTGTITAPNGCHEAAANATFDGRVLRVTVGTARESETEVCTQAARGIEYEASYELGTHPAGVVVEYSDRDFRRVRGNVRPPSRPTGLEVTETGPGTATVSWDPVDADDLSHYVVAYVRDAVPVPEADGSGQSAGAGGATSTEGDDAVTPSPSEESWLPRELTFPAANPWYSVPAGTTDVTIAGLDGGFHTITVHAVDEDGLRSPHSLVTTEVPEGGDVAPIDGTQPTDPDGDGLYEDLNGNGEVDYADVVTYFDNMDQPAMTDHTAAYDYNGNGEIDFADLVDLFQQV